MTRPAIWAPKVYDKLAPYYDLFARWFIPTADNGHQ